MNQNPSSPARKLEILTSRNFNSWLHEQKVSLSFSTYQIGKIFMLGTNPAGKLSTTERTFNRAMGIGLTGNGFWLSTMFQLFKFENMLPQGQSFKGFDKVYIPQLSYTTGDLDIHDVVVKGEQDPVFVNTLFSCLATVSKTHSFKPIWRPPFISKLAAEDRCHLNGMADKDGEPAYVTAVSQSDVNDGWREKRKSGGIVMDVNTNDIICEGLSMPHSPRLYNGKLWLLEAGTGYFGYVDIKTGSFERVTFCPGFLRGLDFIGNYAVAGLSANRKNRTFEGLELDENLKKNNTEPRCGIQIIDLTTGDSVHWVRLEGIINELYDIKAMPGVRNPLLIGMKSDEIKRMISIEE